MAKYRIEISAPSGSGKSFATEILIAALADAGVKEFNTGEEIGMDWVEFEVVDPEALRNAANNTRGGR